STTLLNRIGPELAVDPNVHAITDVTGFGLLGHALEMARGSGVTVDIEADRGPLFTQAARLAQQGFVSGSSRRNWASEGEHVTLPATLPEWRRHLRTDPQSSGGLLVACTAEKAPAVVKRIEDTGYSSARILGHVE